MKEGVVMQRKKMRPTSRGERGNQKRDEERKNQRKAKKGRMEEEHVEKKGKDLQGGGCGKGRL
jgi:hypothetical protein